MSQPNNFRTFLVLTFSCQQHKFLDARAKKKSVEGVKVTQKSILTCNTPCQFDLVIVDGRMVRGRDTYQRNGTKSKAL